MSENTQTHTISKSKSQGIAITTTSSSESQETATTTTTLPPKRTTTNEYSSAKERLQNFFDAEISMYVLPDIDRLTNEIRPDNRGLRGCTIPLAMLLFAVIDLFGFLMRPDKRANKRKTSRNFEFLLSESNYFPPETYSESWERIVRLFRHGVMHQFFPKASGIAKAGLNRPLIYEENNIPILNVDILSRDLVQAIDQIRSDVVDGTDQELIVRMNSRLDSLAEDDYQELDELN